MQTKFPFKNGTMFMITYTPQTIGGEVNHNRKHITRRGKWNDKCKVNKNFIYIMIEIEEIIDMQVINLRLFMFLLV